MHSVTSSLLSGENNQMEMLSLASGITKKLFANDFISKVQTCGWVTTHHLLGLEEWRYLVKNDHKHEKDF